MAMTVLPAKPHFADSCRIGIVGQRHRHTERFMKQMSKRYFALPRKIRRIFDTSREIVAVRSTYTYAGYLVDSVMSLKQRCQSSLKVGYIIIHIGKLTGFYGDREALQRPYVRLWSQRMS